MQETRYVWAITCGSLTVGGGMICPQRFVIASTIRRAIEQFEAVTQREGVHVDCIERIERQCEVYE